MTIEKKKMTLDSTHQWRGGKYVSAVSGDGGRHNRMILDDKGNFLLTNYYYHWKCIQIAN